MEKYNFGRDWPLVLLMIFGLLEIANPAPWAWAETDIVDQAKTSFSKKVMACLGRSEDTYLVDQLGAGLFEKEKSADCWIYKPTQRSLLINNKQVYLSALKQEKEAIYKSLVQSTLRESIKKLLSLQYSYGSSSKDKKHLNPKILASKLCPQKIRFTQKSACTTEFKEDLESFGEAYLKLLQKSRDRTGPQKATTKLNRRIKDLNQSLDKVQWNRSVNQRGYVRYRKTPKTQSNFEEYEKNYVGQISDELGLLLMATPSQSKMGNLQKIENRKSKCKKGLCKHYKHHNPLSIETTEASLEYMHLSIIQYANKTQRHSEAVVSGKIDDKIAEMVRRNPALVGRYLRSNPSSLPGMCSGLSKGQKGFVHQKALEDYLTGGALVLGGIAIAGVMLPFTLLATPAAIVAAAATASGTAAGGVYAFSLMERASSTQQQFDQLYFLDSAEDSIQGKTLIDTLEKKQALQTELMMAAGLSGPVLMGFKKVYDTATELPSIPQKEDFLLKINSNKKFLGSMNNLGRNNDVRPEDVGEFLAHLSLQPKHIQKKVISYISKDKDGWLVQNLIRKIGQSCL